MGSAGEDAGRSCRARTLPRASLPSAGLDLCPSLWCLVTRDTAALSSVSPSGSSKQRATWRTPDRGVRHEGDPMDPSR